jgi:hypothetical protein
MRFVLFLLLVLPALAGEPGVTTYDLYSKGLRVGNVRTERSRVVTNGTEALRCEVTTHVSVNLLVVKHHLDQREVYVSNGEGPLAYEQAKTENGKSFDVRGQRDGSNFVFVVTQDGATRTNSVGASDYDVVGMDGPETGLAKMNEPTTWRVLDMGGARVVERTYTWLRDEDGLRVVEFSDPYKSGRRWVKADDLGLFIARQDGRDKAGTYSMRMSDD